MTAIVGLVYSVILDSIWRARYKVSCASTGQNVASPRPYAHYTSFLRPVLNLEQDIIPKDRSEVQNLVLYTRLGIKDAPSKRTVV